MSALYNPFKQTMLTGSPWAVNITSDTLRMSIGRSSAYTFSAAHQYKSSVATVQNASSALGSVTGTNGVMNFSNPTFTAVASGAALDFVVTWHDRGGADTSNEMQSEVDGFSITPNGGDITIVLDTGSNHYFAI